MSEYIIKAAEWAIDKNGNSLYQDCEEIVRCRDCTQRESDYCYWIDRFIKLNGFCAWAERKERIES